MDKEQDMKIDYMKLRLLIREYFLYNSKFPLLKDIYKICKEKLGYDDTLQHFGRDLYHLRQQGHRMGIIEEEKEYTYKYGGKKKTVKRKVKRIIIR